MKTRTLSRIKDIAGRLKAAGKTVVFTNGCFDILHRGHVEYLSKAKKLGDVLIVGLNSDSSVKKLKGPKRPINRIKDRAVVMSALEAVDYVVVFSESTPLKLIKAIRPDIIVKGGDWKPKDIIGNDLVKKTVSIPFVRGHSTTGLLCKMACRAR